MTKLISLLIGLFVLASCTKDAALPVSVDYFPLQVGNFWEMSFVGTRTIDQIVTLDGKDYYRMVSVRVWKSGTVTKDTVFYRKVEGKVYQRGTKSTDEILRFDLSASSGQTWTYPKDPATTFNPHPWNVTLRTVSDTVHLGNDTLRSCYRYLFDIPQSADEESNIYLAPGIGIVKEVWLGGSPDRIALKRSKINGIEKIY